MTKFQTQRKSFTLIEMLVVVVIIGILAVTLVPRLVGARERASDSGRIVKIWQISSAVELYAQENGSGTYPKAPLSDTPTSVATPSVSSLISPYLTTIPTDPGKGTVAIYNGGGNIMVTGDSFAYWTDTWWTVYAITALMESKKGNTTNAIWVIDKDKEGEYQVVGKGLITYILKVGITHEWNDLIVYDGTNKYIIADRNVGATVAGTWSDSYGHMFQWWNDFWFPNTGHISLTRTTQVDTTGQTSYSNNVYVTSPLIGWWQVIFRDWSKYQNNNLRQWRWPCDEWYHIPTKDEWWWLYNTWKAALSGEIPTTSRMHWKPFRDTLLLPRVGSRSYAGTSNLDSWQGYNGSYWSSTPYADRIYILFFSASVLNTAEGKYRASAISLRCFKDK